jgi:hypothetical protein
VLSAQIWYKNATMKVLLTRSHVADIVQVMLLLTALDRYWDRGGQWGEGGGRVRAFMKSWAVLVWKMFSVPPTNLGPYAHDTK